MSYFYKLFIITTIILQIKYSTSYKDCKNLEFDESDTVRNYFSLKQFEQSDGKANKLIGGPGELTTLKTDLLTRRGSYDYYLRKLDLSRNNIEAINRKPISSVLTVCLVVLDLSHNKISVIDSKAFDDMPHLQKLDLSYNAIQNFESSVFETPKLDNLNLKHNQLENVDTLKELNSLSMLDLSENNIILQSGMFKSLTKLKQVDLSSNNITKVPRGTFEVLTNLELLQMGNNSITEFEFGTLSGLIQLYLFNISWNKLSAENLNKIVLFPLPALRSLLLDGNDARKLNITSLKEHMPKLQHIGIGGIDWDCNILKNSYIEYQKKGISATAHSNLNFKVANVHGIECTLANPPLIIETDYTSETSSNTESTESEISNTESAQSIVKDDVVSTGYGSELKGIGIALIMLVIVLIILVVFKDRVVRAGQYIQNRKRHFYRPRITRPESVVEENDFLS